MQLSHNFVLPVPFDEAWDAFGDLEGLVPCVPGASLLSHDGETFTGAVKVKLGPISMLYGGTGAFLERDRASGRIVVEAKGKDKRGNGTAGATVVAQVTPAGGSTSVQVTTDLAVTGKPAQFGRGVIQDVSDKLLGQFVDAFIAKMAPDVASGAVVAEGAVEETVSGQSAAHAEAAVPASAAQRPDSPPATPAEPAGIPAAAPPTPPAAEPAELNLLSTVLPVLARRYALPAALVVAAGVVVWVWLAR
jgi:Uncharacterized conserved protein